MKNNFNVGRLAVTPGGNIYRIKDIKSLENVINQLKAVELWGGDLDDIVEMSEDLGDKLLLDNKDKGETRME